MILGVGGVFLYQFMGRRRGGGMPNMGGLAAVVSPEEAVV